MGRGLTGATLAVATLGIVAAGVAAGAPGDPRVVHGVQEWPAALGNERFVVVRGDDGQAYYADIGSAQRRGEGPFNAGARVSVFGVEGGRPYELAAMVIGAGDSPLTGMPAPSGGEAAVAASPPTAAGRPIPPAAPPAAGAPAPPAAGAPAPPAVRAPAPPAARPAEPAAPKENWQRFEGTVDSISGAQLVLRTPDQGSVTLDISGLSGQVRTLRAGDPVVVFAVPQESGSLVATGYIQSQRAPAPSQPTP